MKQKESVLIPSLQDKRSTKQVIQEARRLAIRQLKESGGQSWFVPTKRELTNHFLQQT